MLALRDLVLSSHSKKTSPMVPAKGCIFIPNENTRTIGFEAIPGLIRKESSPPLITRPVDILVTPLQISSPMA
ncbi:hypothetical protein TNCV_537951 [Trichonephila clavipes]|nr:hypothetical protein TNCV_537951 [Trichonephila clavipes]